MIPVRNIAQNVGRALVNNSPAILTGLGVTGVVSTAVLVGKGAFSAAAEIDAQSRWAEPPTLKQAFLLTWKNYIPAALVGVATITAIIGANSISSRRNAAIISAYSLTDRAFREYRDKVVETIGEGKEEKVRAEVAQERWNREEMDNREIIDLGTGTVLCYDTRSGRSFLSDKETIRKAQNDINELVINSEYASMNDFYRKIGLPATSDGEEVGWTTSNMLSLAFSSILTDGDKPALCLDYHLAPVRNYNKAFGPWN